MRLRYALAALSLAVFGSAVAIPRQQDPLAEAQFKNIKSFKGDKASDVIPAMEFMSASLKVECDFCHTADRASDEKRPKLTAREMISMQRDINAKNFGGRNQVTCATCHAGHIRPVGVPPVEGGDVRARRSPDVDPTKVLAAYGKAVGGDPAHPITALKLSGTNSARGQNGRLDATFSAGKFSFQVHRKDGDNKVGFNGAMMWFTTPQGVQSIPLVYAEAFMWQSQIFTGPDSLPKLTGPTGGTSKIGERDMQVVTGTIAGEKTRLALYFDAKTGLLARTQFSYPTILGSIVQINDFSDYKKVAGVQVPMTVLSHSAEDNGFMRFTSGSAVATVDAKLFDPPK